MFLWVSHIYHLKGVGPLQPKIFKGPPVFLCGSVAEWLGYWTCDQQVVGLNPSLSAVKCNPGQVVNTHVPLSPSSITWYQPMLHVTWEGNRRSGVALATRHRH